MKVLVPAMMSSEESEDEENINYVKDLPWRASIVKEFFSDLDKHFEATKSAQADKKSCSKCFCLLPTSPTGNTNLGSKSVTKQNVKECQLSLILYPFNCLLCIGDFK